MTTASSSGDVNAVCVGPTDEKAGKVDTCRGCPNQSSCSSGTFRGPDPELANVKERMSNVKHTLLVLSGKGGVGKSTVASQIAWNLALRGAQVGVLDVDICGPSMPRMLGVEDQEVQKSNMGWCPVYAHENLAVMSVGFMLQSKNDAIIWRGPRKTALIKQFLCQVDWNELDFLVVDAPPGTSDEHISISHYLKECNPDGAIIVTTPQEISLLDVRKEISFCRKSKIPILGVIENMSGFVCPCCSTTSNIFPGITGGARAMCSELDVPFLGAIPLDPRVLQCCEKGISFMEQYPDVPASKAYESVINSVITCTDSLTATANTCFNPSVLH